MAHPLISKKNRTKAVTIDGDEYFVRVWTLGERLAFGEAAKAESADLAIVALKFSVANADGTPAFTDADTELLKTKADGVVSQQLIDEGLKLNGFKTNEVDAAKKD